MNKLLVAPSILSADFANLQDSIKKIESAGADWVHIDVMDGHFVPNITIGAPVVKDLRKTTKLIFDVHLMIENPKKYISDFAKAGADYITVHEEACKNDLEETITLIKAHNIKAGVAIKPNTPASAIERMLKKIDLALVMSVEPGFGGQSFMQSSLEKIANIRLIAPELDIQVDGGINEHTAKLVREAGANVLVAGSYIYNSPNYQKAIDSLK